VWADLAMPRGSLTITPAGSYLTLIGRGADRLTVSDDHCEAGTVPPGLLVRLRPSIIWFTGFVPLL
jgi:hypothetical protein